MHLPRLSRALGAVSLLVLLFAPGCQRAKAGPEPLALRSCRLEGVSKALECGEVEVWEDRAAKQGRRLKLKVAVARALAPQPEPDPLFVLAGGPGQAATEVARGVLPWLERVRRHRDIVFLDQRGTGAQQSARLPRARDGRAAVRAAPAGAARGRAGGVSRRLRRGRPRSTPRPSPWTIWTRCAGRSATGASTSTAVSYGTRAALVYLRQHGEHVRTATLDGVAPLSLYLPLSLRPRRGGGARRRLRALPRGRRLRQGLPRARPRFRALLGAAGGGAGGGDARRIPGPERRSRVALQRDHLMGTVRSDPLRRPSTAMVPLLLDRASRGDFGPLLAMMEATSGGGAAGGISLGMFYSVVCSEDAPFIPPGGAGARGRGHDGGRRCRPSACSTRASSGRGARCPPATASRCASDVPVLLLSGALDPVTPPALGRGRGEDAAPAPGTSWSRAWGTTPWARPARAAVMRDFITAGSVEGLENGCSKAPGAPNFLLDFAGPTP